jgi:hypothetical protein
MWPRLGRRFGTVPLGNVARYLAPPRSFFLQRGALTRIGRLASEAGALQRFVQIPSLDRHPTIFIQARVAVCSILLTMPATVHTWPVS